MMRRGKAAGKLSARSQTAEIWTDRPRRCRPLCRGATKVGAHGAIVRAHHQFKQAAHNDAYRAIAVKRVRVFESRAVARPTLLPAPQPLRQQVYCCFQAQTATLGLSQRVLACEAVVRFQLLAWRGLSALLCTRRADTRKDWREGCLGRRRGLAPHPLVISWLGLHRTALPCSFLLQPTACLRPHASSMS